MRTLTKRLALSLPVAALLAFANGFGPASAQTVFDPVASPELNTGGWINDIGILMLALGTLATLAVIFGYMRFSSKFRGTSDDPATVLAPKVQVGAVAARPAGPPPQVAAPTAAPATAPAAAPAALAAAPAVVTPTPAPTPAAPAAATAPKAATAPAAAAVPASDKPAHVEPDQETFDRVLQEQLDKGVDRRVAEGRARSAAIVAARKKAGG